MTNRKKTDPPPASWKLQPMALACAYFAITGSDDRGASNAGFAISRHITYVEHERDQLKAELKKYQDQEQEQKAEGT